MVVRTVLTWPEKKLRNISSAITDFDEAKSIAGDLRDTLIASFGLGIAASQVGIHKRIVVVKSEELSCSEEDPDLPGYKVFVNPTLTVSPESRRVNSQEACLSIPGVAAQVQRDSCVSINYQNLSGESFQELVSNRDACILQHEFDHLDGKLFIDRLSQIRKKMVVSKLRKRMLKVKNFDKDYESAKKEKIKRKRAKLRSERKKKKKNKR